MKKIGAFVLAVLLATPALMSAQGMGHQHQQGQQQMGPNEWPRCISKSKAFKI
jgi:hypothetical protein